mgnify:CR=1 FL=1
MQVNMYGAANAARKRSAEQTAQQGDQSDANQGNTAASHELLHALALGAGVVVAVTFQQVDNAPDTETGTERDNEGLKNGDCLFKKCHIVC